MTVNVFSYDQFAAPVHASGFLFIGDPHLTARAPTRRIDPYADNVLLKLQKCIDVANEERLVPVITGDIFHHAVEVRETIKTRLLNVMASCWTKVISNLGNHDTANLTLSESDTISVIGASGHLNLMSEGGPAMRFDLDGTVVGLGFAPYGSAIPHDVRGVFQAGDVDEIVWVTHHDIAFDGAYPGSMEPFEIDGCALVINGHMHLPKPCIQAGQTTWFNIGNITRTAIDAINHEPAAWRFTVDRGMERVPLPFRKDVFDLASRFVEEEGVGSDAGGEADSAFVDLLQADVEAGVGAASSDGGLLLEEIKARFEREKTPTAIRAIILSQFRRISDTMAKDSIKP